MSYWFKENEPGGFIDADFLQYYGIDVFKAYEEDKFKVYRLIGNLPEESRTKTSQTDGQFFNWERYILSRIEFLQHAWLYANKDKDSKMDEPELQVPEKIKEIIEAQSEQNEAQLSDEELKRYLYDKNFY